MYTQCPECATAFRVTADVLKQAAGKVRCGGCGNAFSALEYLSESKPAAPAPPDAEDDLPELKPDSEPDVPGPQTISPAQSAALLKTLDELAGSDIRLEDTGVEWRLMDDDEASGEHPVATGSDSPATDLHAEAQPSQTDTPVGNDSDANELPQVADGELEDADPLLELDEDAPGQLPDGDVAEPTEEPVAAKEELRFDDNTGLPDDFDDGDDDHAAAYVPVTDEAPAAEPAETPVVVDERSAQIDLAFGDSEEWGALLDEVDDNAVDDGIEPLTAEQTQAAFIPAEDAETNDGPSLVEELEQRDEQESLPEVEPAAETPAAETDPDTQIESLDTADEVVPQSEAPEEPGDELALVETAIDALEAEADAQNPQAEAEDSPETEADDSIPDSTSALEFEIERAQRLSEELLTETMADENASLDELEEQPSTHDAMQDLEQIDGELNDLEEALDAAESRVAAGVSGDSVAEAENEPQIDESAATPVSTDEDSMNEAIDKELLQASGEYPAEMFKADNGPVPEDVLAGETVETIIMEGESVRTALGDEDLEADDDIEGFAASDAGMRTSQKLESGFIAAAKRTFRGRITDVEDDSPPKPKTARWAAGIGILGLLLAGQFVHQSRAELATVPAIGNTIVPLYEALGRPITPRWDVTGWSFEVSQDISKSVANNAASPATMTGATLASDATDLAASDSTPLDENGEPLVAAAEIQPEPTQLTIYSRIGNTLNKPLPYPLIRIALTDRYDETIGSRLLEPDDYLAEDIDVNRMVAGGNSFNALIVLDSPDEAPYGFKLNVCYRQADERLRCDHKDFRTSR